MPATTETFTAHIRLETSCLKIQQKTFDLLKLRNFELYKLERLTKAPELNAIGGFKTHHHHRRHHPQVASILTFAADPVGLFWSPEYRLCPPQ